MKRIWALATVGLLTMSSSARAAEESRFVSTTFQDILHRVVSRDKESQAIIEVKPKTDAAHSGTLRFSIAQVPLFENETVITLSVNTKMGDMVYEKYRLRTDEAMRRELDNHKRMAELEQKRLTQVSEQRKKNIAELSGGTLREGMTLEKVIEVKGQPQKIEPVVYRGAAAQLPQFEATFADIIITFNGRHNTENRLFSVRQKPQPQK